jgi:protein-S-isoprenylcysteine O-methyltransferase Ste14
MKKGPSAADIIFLLLQLALFVLYFWRPEFIDVNILDNLAMVIGAIPMLVGVIMIIWALINIQGTFSFFATPREGGELITHGIYKYVRHPIYSGIIMLAIGYSFFDLDDGLRRMFITLLLLLFFHFKAGYEERRLSRMYTDYDAYKVRTGKFLPNFMRYKFTRSPSQPPEGESDKDAETETSLESGKPPLTWGDG